MARTNKTTKTTKATRTTKPSNKSRKPTKLNFFQRKLDTKLVVFILIFAALGTYLLVRSRANPGVGFKLAEVAANITTAQQGPRIVRETTGNKRNADVVYVSAPNGQSNHVYVTYNATDAGTYKVCGFGRRNDGGTAKLYAANAPYPYTTARPESYVEADYPVTIGTDYKAICTTLTLANPGTVYITDAVSSGVWNFSVNSIELLEKRPTYNNGGDKPPVNNSYPTSREQTGLGRLGVSASSLSVYNGPTTIETDGAVIENVRITRPLMVKAKNVTLKKVDINGIGSDAVLQVEGPGFTIEDSDVHGYGTERLVRLWAENATMRRVAVWGGESGVNVSSGATIEDTFINPNNSSGNGQHTTAIGVSGGTRNVHIVRSYLLNASQGWQSSSVSIYPENWAGGPNYDWLVENSYLGATSAYYALYAGHTPKDGERPNQRLVFRNNTIAKGRENYVASWSGARTTGPNGNEYGNVWDNNKDPNGTVIRL